MTSHQANSSYLVTGVAGFIGSRFVESCNQRGIPVIGVDALAHLRARTQGPRLELEKTIDRDELLHWLEQDRPRLKAIVHIGARTDTAERDEKVLDRLNLHYTQALWNYATREGIPFVYASSAATYGGGEQGYDDDESKLATLKPLNLYGWSKQKFDLWALEQEKAGNHPPTWSGYKFFNVYGFGEAHKGFMASVVLHAHDQILKGGEVKLFKSHREGIANGHQMRDFVFVDDLVDVLHFALEKPIRRGIFNLGSGKARTFLDLAKATFKALGRPENITFIDTPASVRNQYQYFTEAKMEKLRREGYTRPFTSLEDGVAKYVQRLG